MRMVRLGKMAKKMEKVAKTGVQLSRLLGIVLLLMHWVTCGWNFAGTSWRCRGLLGVEKYISAEAEKDCLSEKIRPSF